MTEEQKAKARERSKKYYQKNKEKILSKQKEYHKIRYKNDEEYRKKCNERSRKYRETNPEKVKEIKRKSFKKYYQEHKEYYRNYNKKYSDKYGYHWYKNKLEDYKSRCEKAVEILKEAGCYDEEIKSFCDDIWEELPDLLNILKGSDE